VRTARERIDHAAYALFSRHGTKSVGIDAVLERSGVAKATLYRHYRTKDELILGFLRRREQVWTKDWLAAELERRASTPKQRLLAMFDVYDGWFRKPDFEGCSFVNVLLEHGAPGHPVKQAAVQQLAAIREFIAGLARDAGVRDVEAFARQWQMILKGAIVAAHAGDQDAAGRAKEIAAMFLTYKTAR
jgi:AcrR family transcriptional regulator